MLGHIHCSAGPHAVVGHGLDSSGFEKCITSVMESMLKVIGLFYKKIKYIASTIFFFFLGTSSFNIFMIPLDLIINSI